MSRPMLMMKLARWHIWLGWLAALPILVWIATGLFMAARPIEEVRGQNLRIAPKPVPVTLALRGATRPLVIREGKVIDQRGRPILLANLVDERVVRIDLRDPDNGPLPPVDEAEARLAVGQAIAGGDQVATARLFDAAHVPIDFRRPVDVWQVVLRDGTHVYVGRDSGEIEAVRTSWWRAYDFMWGLHIMDPAGREDTSNIWLWLFGAFALATSLMGSILLFRRRKAQK